MQVEHKILSLSSVILALVILSLSIIHPTKVGAEDYQPGQNERMISLDKKVRSIDDKNFSNNIESSQKIFREGETIEFSIAIENSGRVGLNNIVVTDKLPTNLSLIFFPGTLDRTNNSISWKIDQLNVAEIKTFYIRAKIINTKDLDLANGKLVKMTNIADSRSDTGTSAGDQASYYIGAGTVSKSIPKTGANDLIIQTGLVLMTGSLGLFLRKLARGY